MFRRHKFLSFLLTVFKRKRVFYSDRPLPTPFHPFRAQNRETNRPQYKRTPFRIPQARLESDDPTPNIVSHSLRPTLQSVIDKTAIHTIQIIATAIATALAKSGGLRHRRIAPTDARLLIRLYEYHTHHKIHRQNQARLLILMIDFHHPVPYIPNIHTVYPADNKF